MQPLGVNKHEESNSYQYNSKSQTFYQYGAMQPSIAIKDDDSTSSPAQDITNQIFKSTKFAQSPSPSPGVKDMENPF